jgi:outer membrane protein
VSGLSSLRHGAAAASFVLVVARAIGVHAGENPAAPAVAGETPAGVAPAQVAAVELSVEDAVAATLAAQPRLRAGEAEVKAAAARATQASWKYVGTVETTGLYTPAQRPLTIEFPGIPNVLPATSFEVKQLQTYALSATLTQPLWTWGAITSNRASAQKDLAASREGVGRLRQQLVLEASQAFFVAAAAGAGVRVSEEALAQQQAFVRATRSRMEAGTAARLDLLKAELAVSSAESGLLASRNRETLARETLVSLSLDERFRVAKLRVDETAPALPAESDAVARALVARPDIESLRRRAEGLGLRVRAVRGAALPALALRASLTQQNDEVARVFGKSGQVYQLSLALSWDATEPFRSRARVAELRALQDAVVQEIQASEQGIALEVRAALLDATEARQQVQLARGALATAEEQARVARLAYGEGAISALEARDADLGLTTARFALLRAHLDLAVAQARLRCARGD